MPGGDIGSGARVEAVDALQDLGVDPSQVVAFGFVEFVEPGHLAMGDDVDLDRPACGEGHEGGEVLGFDDHPLPRLAFEGKDVCHQRPAGDAPMPLRASRRDRGVRGDIRISIDLSVRMVHRHADLLTAVLEHEDLFDARQRRQFGTAVGPGVDDGAGTRRAEFGEGSLVLGGEDDDFAPTESGGRQRGRPTFARCLLGGSGRDVSEAGPERGEPVLEDDDVEVCGRNLGGSPVRGRAQRTFGCGGQVGPRLTVRGHSHPFPGEHVEAKCPAVGPGFDGAGIVDDRRGRRVRILEEQNLTAIGQRRPVLWRCHQTSQK